MFDTTFDLSNCRLNTERLQVTCVAWCSPIRNYLDVTLDTTLPIPLLAGFNFRTGKQPDCASNNTKWTTNSDLSYDGAILFL